MGTVDGLRIVVNADGVLRARRIPNHIHLRRQANA